MSRRKKRPESIALNYSTPVSARYEQRTRYWMECFDKLPPILRKAVREAMFDTAHDPTELWAFARMKHNRPESLVAQVELQDKNRLEQFRIVPPTFTAARSPQRALSRRHLKPDTWAVRASADRAMAPEQEQETPKNPQKPLADPVREQAALPALVRIRRALFG